MTIRIKFILSIFLIFIGCTPEYLTTLDSSSEQSGIISPINFNIATTDLKTLKGGSPDYNAKILQNILNGEKGPQRDIVVFNAAAGIKVGGRASSMEEGIKLAEEAIDSGLAHNVLKSLINIK